MEVVSTGQHQQILSQVRGWPPGERLTLARAILESLEANIEPRGTRPKGLGDLLGLLKTDNPPPTDEECQRYLEEELIRKFGQ